MIRYFQSNLKDTLYMRWLTHVVALELSRKLCDSEHALTLAFVVRRQLL